jgi:septal ring factor EnvC (AmiA/AmiB activator)
MMQWERKQVEEEKAKLQNQLEVTRIMLRRAENRLEKANHDRDRYKRRIDALQGEIKVKNAEIEAYRNGERPQLEKQREQYSNVILAYANEVEYFKRLVEHLISKKDG